MFINVKTPLESLLKLKGGPCDSLALLRQLQCFEIPRVGGESRAGACVCAALYLLI